MLKYFKNKKPVLEELMISACKTKLSQTNELLRVLSDYTKLKRLGFNQTKLDKTSMNHIADIANGNSDLIELDLAWNQVTSLSISIVSLTYFRYVGVNLKSRVQQTYPFLELKLQQPLWNSLWGLNCHTKELY